MISLHLFISGRVQGIGYRRFIQKHARELGITGWIRNRLDRRVEAVLQADSGMPEEDQKRLDHLLQICWKGPFLADVSDIQLQEVQEKTFVGFTILDTE